MKKYLSILVFIAISIPAITQDMISGQVTDQNKEPIFFATVALFNASDSSYVTAESTDESGRYLIRDIQDGSYYLEVSMLSFAKARKGGIQIPAKALIDIDFQLESDAALLSTVEIKGKLPLLEQRADKLIVNVENNMTNTNGSLLDVMKKVPGMLVVNDRLSMPGSGSPTILINGKTTQYMDVQSLLRDMPGDNIKKVEVIHQPGAEYEASGSGPIINIILKKNVLFGTNGSISLGVGKGELWDYTTGLNLSHYAGKLNVSGGLGYSRNSYVDGLDITRNITGVSTSIDGVYSQVNRDASMPHTYRGNLRLDYDVTDRHRIGFETKYYENQNQRVQTNTTEVNLFGENETDYTLFTDNDIDKTWNYFAVNPYYIFEIDSAGQKLQFDVNVASYQPDGFNTLSTTNSINDEVQKQRYIQPGDTKIYATTLDYVKPLNSALELKTGIKYSFADLDNDLRSEYFENGSWLNNPLQSNHYLFDEKIYAVYSKFSYANGPWAATAGLRYENSQSSGMSVESDTTLTRDISKLFPSASISRDLGALTSTVSYSYRIDRPRYSTLNPFLYYLDPFTYETGNPNIRPELTHSTKFTLSMEGQPFFNIEYKKSKDAIVEITRQDANSEEASKIDINFDDRSSFNVSLFLPVDLIPGVKGGYAGIIGSNTQYNSILGEQVFKRSQWAATIVAQFEFGLPWDINAELGGWYNSGGQEGIFTSEHLYGTSFGMSKKFMNDKAKLSFGVEDFIRRFWHAEVDYQQDLKLISSWQAPVVNARFSYKFGNKHLKSKKKHRASASDEINRATQG